MGINLKELRSSNSKVPTNSQNTGYIQVGGLKLSTQKNNEQKKKKWYKKIIKKSNAFDDGYDFGDITKSAAATTGDLLLSAGKGIASVGDSAAKLAASGIAQAADWIGQDEYAQRVRNNIAGKNEKTNEILKKYTPTGIMNTAQEKIDKNSVSGETLDNVAQAVGYTSGIAAAGGVLGKAATIPVGSLKVPTLSVISGAGNATSEVYSKDSVSDAQAWTKILGSGAIEGAAESLFSVMNVGGSPLDDALQKKVSKLFSSGAGKVLSQVGISATGETAEEFLSYAGNYLLDNHIINKMGDADFTNNWDWEDLGEQMAVAFISSGLSQGGSAAVNINQTINQNIKAQEQSLGRTLTNEEKSNIKSNSILEYAKIVEGTNADKENSNIDKFEYVKSDNQKIDNFRKSMVEFNFNNSQEAINLNKIAEKIITEKNYNIVFDNTIKNDKGITVNGLINTNQNGEVEIRLNPNSERMGEFLLVHEITHAIETNDMKNMIMNFAKRNANFNTALENLKQTYNTNDVSSEVIADISGQLLGNQEFINSLSMENTPQSRNIIKRIYESIVKLANSLTEEGRYKNFVKDLETKWKEAYRTQNNNLNGIEYSIGGLQGVNNVAGTNFYNSAIDNYNKALELAKNNVDNETIRQQTKWFQDKNGDWKFEFTDIEFSLIKNINEIKKDTNYKLKELINHKYLNELYPEIMNYDVKFKTKKSNGSFLSYDNTIEISNRLIDNKSQIDLEGTLLHEIQHAIQHYENFEGGKNSKLSKKTYYESLGEIEADDTKRRFILEKNNNQIRNLKAPKSSLNTPTHPNYNNYMENRNVIDKLKDGLYDYIGNWVEKYDKNSKKSNEENNSQNWTLVDGRRLLKEELDNSSFSMNNNKWQEHLEKNYPARGTRTDLNKIKVPVKQQINIKNNNVKYSENEQLQEENKTAQLLDNRPLKQQKGLKDQAKRLYQSIVDKGEYVAELSKKSGNKELYAKYDQMGTARGTAEYSIGVEQVNNDGKKIGKSLIDIWEPITNSGKEFDFSMYLLHKHNIDRWNQGKPVFGEDITSDISKSAVQQYESDNPEFIEWSKDINKYNKNLLQNMVDAGLTSEESQQYYNDTYTNYVRIYRDVTGNSPITIQNGNLKVNSPIKKAKGGNQDILPLKDSMAQQTLEVTNAIRRNQFGLELLNVLGNGENVTEYGNEVISKNEDGTYSFTVFESGKPIKMQIDEGLYESIKPTKNYDIESKLPPLKITKKLLQFQRGLITDKNPFFLLRNFFKDLGDAPLNSKYTTKFIKNFPRAYYEISTNGDYAKLYKAMGGYQQSYFDSDNGLKYPSNKVTSKFIQKIQGLNQAVEMAPRLAEFISSIESGETIQTAMYNAAEITTNFKRGGEATKLLNKYFSNFLNASVQGFDKQIRNFSGQNGAKGYVNILSKAVVFGVLPSILNHLLLDDDEDYEDLPDYIKDNYYLFKTKDNEFVRIPKGRVVSVFGNAAVRTLRYANGDKKAFKGYLSNAATNVAPNNPIGSNVLSPFIQVATNKSWNGSEIVPQRLQDLPAAEQFDEKTDSLSKVVGKIFNISPKKVNYMLDQYSGVFGDTILPMLTPQAERNPLTSAFSTNSINSNKYVSEFYDTKEEMTKKSNSVNATDNDILKTKYLNSIQSEISDLYKEKREIQMSDLKDKDKIIETDKIQKEINEIVKNALKKYDKVNAKSNFATIDDMNFYKNNDNEWIKVKSTDKGLNIAIDSGINMEEYIKYKNTEFKSDKDTNGKSITNSRKNKIFKYVQNLKLSIPEKAIIIKLEYPSFDNYNSQIIKYINSRDISYYEKTYLLEELGFTIKNGRVYSE